MFVLMLTSAGLCLVALGLAVRAAHQTREWTLWAVAALVALAAVRQVWALLAVRSVPDSVASAVLAGPEGVALALSLCAPVFVLWTAQMVRRHQRALAAARTHETQLERSASELERRVAERGVELQTARDWLDLATRVSPTAVYVGDLTGRTHYISPNSEALFGYSPAEITAAANVLLEGVAREDRGQVLAVRARAPAAGGGELEYRFRRKDGREIWIHEQFRCLTAEARERTQICGVAVDITARKRAESELVAQNAVLRGIFHGSSDGISLKDTQGRYVMANEAAARLLGRSVAELIGRDDEAILGGELGRQLRAEDFAALAAGRSSMTDDTVIIDGQVRCLLTARTPLRDESGQVCGVLGIARDITDRKYDEQALTSAERFAKSVADSLTSNLCVLDADGTITFTNRAWHSFAAQSGGTQEFCGAGANYLAVCERSGDPVALQAAAGVRAVLAGQRSVFELEYECHAPDRPGWCVARVTRMQPPMPPRAVIEHVDITPFKQAQRRLHASNELLRAVLEETAEGITLLDREFRFVLANAAVERSLDAPRARIIGRTPEELFGAEEFAPARAAVEQVFRDGRSSSQEETYTVRGEPRTFVCSRTAHRNADGEIVGVITVSRDVTDERRQEERLREAERLVSIGTLAAGIAHEINNPIGGILMSAQSARTEFRGAAAEPFVARCLDEIVEDARRCGRIVKSVLRFARHEPTEKWPNDVNAVVQHACKLLRSWDPSAEGRITFALDPDLPPAELNPTEFEQVVVNLVRNALESGPEVRASVQTLADNGGIKLCVSDDGPGMEAGEARRAFDPFFTTRRKRGGVGLGLSVVHGIVTSHGGTVELSSSVGAGTRVTVCLPLRLAEQPVRVEAAEDA